MEPTFDKNSELLADLQSLRQHPGYNYIIGIIRQWETQANEDVMTRKDPAFEDEYRGEWKAYRRVGKLLDTSIKDLQEPKSSTDVSDFDPYKSNQ
jgi:hypothetical protein